LTGIFFNGPKDPKMGIPSPKEFGDLYVSVEGRIVRGKGGDFPAIDTCEYGYYFSMDSGDYYGFAVTEAKKKFNGWEYTTMMFHFKTGFNIQKNIPGIRTDAPNVLAAKLEGKKVTYYLNGILVAEGQGNKNPSGVIVLHVFYGGKDKAEFEFDNFQVYGPRESSS
jgi:hypothetical protein